LTQPVAEIEPNDTLDHAQDLGTLSVGAPAEVVSTLGQGPAGAAEVDWYTFSLSSPADVHLATRDQGVSNSLTSVLSLYNSDLLDSSDPYDPLQHRLLAQDDGSSHGGDAQIDRLLGPGTYAVAVSGSGNRYFHPYVSGSGYAGSTGAYGLQMRATDAGISPGDGPAVLTTDPAPGSTLARSPFVIRVDLSGPLNPATFVYAAPGQNPSIYANPAPGQTIELRFSATGDFSAGNYSDIPITPTFSTAANELQIAPAAPLSPGIYQLFLAGDSTNSAAVLADPSSPAVPLGQNSQNPNGADYVAMFQINGIDGVAGARAADNTLATAQQLGDITTAGLRQLPGAIGIDPTATTPFDPTGVDWYHFQVHGSGRFALTAEAFAGRIGSPLDPVLALYQYQAANQSLQLVGWNDNTLNNTPATQGLPPLTNDPVLLAGLTGGDYYLAVYSSGNVPNTSPGLVPNGQGPVDPTAVFHSQAGATTGDYVLNLGVQAWNQTPQVVDTTPSDGSTLTAPPTQVVVHFSEPVNLQQLAYEQDQQNASGGLAAVFIQGADGNPYYPRFQSYDPDTGQATFLMLDALPSGVNQLHLSGPLGLTDLAGNPLAGNDLSGDYVVRFTVPDYQRGSPGQPLTWQFTDPSHDPANPQPVGVLFPHDLQTGVTLERLTQSVPTNNPADVADYYQFQILQSRPYIFSLSGSNLLANAQPTLTDAAGNSIPLLPQGNGSLYLVSLDPGVYVVQVGGWTADTAANVTYQLGLTLGPSQENPTPLTVRPAPAFRLLVANTPAPTPSPAGNPPPPPSAPPPSTPPAPDPASPPTSTSSNPPSTIASNPPPVAPNPAPVTSPPPTLNLPPPGPSSPPATPVVGPSPAAPGSNPSGSQTVIATGTPSVPEPAPRLVLPPPTGNIVNSQTVQTVTRDTPADFRSLGNTLSDGSAGRSDVPTFTNGIPAGFTREGAAEGRFSLTIPANALAGLSAVPVGGLRGSTTQEPDAQAPQRWQPQGNDTPPPAEHRSRVPPEVRRFLEKIWQQRLDYFFARTFSGLNLADWLKQLQMILPTGEDVPADSGREQPGEPEAALPRAHSEDSLRSATDWAWASGFVIVGMMLPRDTRKRHRPRSLAGWRGTAA
jgi:hypothetical protein